MKYMTSGDIHRMFKQEDEGTIIGVITFAESLSKTGLRIRLRKT